MKSITRSNSTADKIGNLQSEWTELPEGVPKVSLHGPLIFNIYQKDIFYFVNKGDLYNHAYDNFISIRHKDISVFNAHMKNERQVIAKWFTDNSMINSKEVYYSRAVWYRCLGFIRECGHCLGTENRDFLGVCIDKKIDFDVRYVFQRPVPKYLL